MHLAVRWLGREGERLNPKKADLEAWRQGFARALRDRGVAAEATPRRARGVSLKPERMPLRRLRERHEAAIGAPAHRIRSAYLEAGRAAFGGATEPAAWERRLAERQARIRQLYGAQAELLKGSADPDDRKLGVEVERFVLGMPLPDSRRLELARQLRAANRALARDGRADREPGR